jgi:hypothetical protein
MARQYGGEKPEIVREVTDVALAHRLVSPYTSFVAVEERIEVAGGVPRTVVVPVEMPEGVSYEGVFGEADAMSAAAGKMQAYSAGRAPGTPMSRSHTRGGRGVLDLLAGGLMTSRPRDESWAMRQLTPQSVPAASDRPLSATITADRTRARAGEPITLTITLTNISATAVALPARLEVGAANVVLRIIDSAWHEVSAAASVRGAPVHATQALAPGATVTFRITLGGPAGIRLPGSGAYHIAVASAGGVAADSDLVTVHIMK